MAKLFRQPTRTNKKYSKNEILIVLVVLVLAWAAYLFLPRFKWGIAKQIEEQREQEKQEQVSPSP